MRLSIFAAAVFAAVFMSGAAQAQANRFDGTCPSVEIITEKGECDKAYRYAIAIQDGRARYAGPEGFNISGSVSQRRGQRQHLPRTRPGECQRALGGQYGGRHLDCLRRAQLLGAMGGRQAELKDFHPDRVSRRRPPPAPEGRPSRARCG